MGWQKQNILLFLGIALLGAVVGSLVIVGASVLGAIFEAAQEEGNDRRR